MFEVSMDEEFDMVIRIRVCCVTDEHIRMLARDDVEAGSLMGYVPPEASDPHDDLPPGRYPEIPMLGTGTRTASTDKGSPGAARATT